MLHNQHNTSLTHVDVICLTLMLNIKAVYFTHKVNPVFSLTHIVRISVLVKFFASTSLLLIHKFVEVPVLVGIKMAEFVEGDWKNFTFKMAKPEDYLGILEHLNQSFYLDEPQNILIGQSEQKNKDMDNFALGYLAENLSFFVIDRENNKIVGARVTGIHRKDDDPLKAFSELKSPELIEFFPNITELLEEANTFERFGIDHFADFLFLSVDRTYRGQGLGMEMYERAIKLLKAKGFTAGQSIFSNPHSQNIARKLGFVELARRKLKDYKKPDGSILFPQAGDDQVAIVMTKII